MHINDLYVIAHGDQLLENSSVTAPNLIIVDANAHVPVFCSSRLSPNSTNSGITDCVPFITKLIYH